MGKEEKLVEDEIEIPGLQERSGLVKYWAKVLDPVCEVVKERRGREPSLWDQAQTAQCLENLKNLLVAKRNHVPMFEDTHTSDVESLSKFGFPVIAAAMSTLASSDVVSTQASDRKQGAVYWLDYQYDRRAVAPLGN